MYLYLAPSDIRFTQSTINPDFHHGGNINDVIDSVCRGRMEINKFPPIRVTKRHNKYYSWDNRRLYMFRVLQKRGYLSKMKVLVVSAWDDEKFTTENDGESVRVRRDETRDHTFDKVNFAPHNIVPETRRSTRSYDDYQPLRQSAYYGSGDSYTHLNSFASSAAYRRPSNISVASYRSSQAPRREKSFCEEMFSCTIL